MPRKLSLCKGHVSFVWVLETPKSSINLNLWAWGGSRAAGFPQSGKLSVRRHHCILSEHVSAVAVQSSCSCSVLPMGWAVRVRAVPLVFQQPGSSWKGCSTKTHTWMLRGGTPLLSKVQTLLFPCLYQQICSDFTVPFGKSLARGLGLEHCSSLKQFAAGGYGGAISQFEINYFES